MRYRGALKEEMKGNLETLLYEAEKSAKQGDLRRASFLLDDAWGLLHENQLYEYEGNLVEMEEMMEEMLEKRRWCGEVLCHPYL